MVQQRKHKLTNRKWFNRENTNGQIENGSTDNFLWRAIQPMTFWQHSVIVIALLSNIHSELYDGSINNNTVTETKK